LFAGVGGIEAGLARSGHEALLLCENDPGAQEVLRTHFGDHAHVVGDVREVRSISADVELLTAGFPCTDISQAGRTAGIRGAKSGLIGEVWRLLESRAKVGAAVPWILLENVPFMLSLAKGEAMEVIVSMLEHFGYRWAYRVVDTRAFGLPQRRQRVLILAALHEDPRAVLFADDAGPPLPLPKQTWRLRANGFYWTEGNRGLGWADDAVPTLKAGSTVGIPSPPAIVRVDGTVVQPNIKDAERLQGFGADWTAPAENAVRPNHRWRYVGNAVTVDVAAWIGERLRRPGRYDGSRDVPLERHGSWPRAAWNDTPHESAGRHAADLSQWPVRREYRNLEGFLEHEPRMLSAKATQGFHKRITASSLWRPEGFDSILEQHLRRMLDGDRKSA